MSSRRYIKSANFQRIVEILGCFGEDAKRKFDESLNERDITIFGNAVRERHEVAHKYGTDISFNDLKEAVAAGVRIMESFEIAISP